MTLMVVVIILLLMKRVFNMNKYEVLTKIAEFVDYDECVVIKQNDWDDLTTWVKSLPKEIYDTRPDFYILPVKFKEVK